MKKELTSNTFVRIFIGAALSSAMILATGLQNRNGTLFFCISIVFFSVIFSCPKRVRASNYFALALAIFISAHASYIFISDGIDDFRKIAIDGYTNFKGFSSSKLIVSLLLTLGGLSITILARFIALMLMSLASFWASDFKK